VRGGTFIRSLAPAIEAAVYRMVQEALTNVARHANARTVRVRFDVEPSQARLLVEDDGRGFPAGSDHGSTEGSRGLGLAGIRERARLLGGEASVESVPGRGTLIEVKIPLSEQSA
jgi:signal transduction histidine kinase